MPAIEVLREAGFAVPFTSLDATTRRRFRRWVKRMKLGDRDQLVYAKISKEFLPIEDWVSVIMQIHRNVDHPEAPKVDLGITHLTKDQTIHKVSAPLYTIVAKTWYCLLNNR